MLFTTILLAATLVAWAIGRRAGWRDHARRGLAAAMVVAGAAHLGGPDPFVQHLPDWVPARYGLVYLTGLAEIAIGAALVARPAWRPTAGRLLALYLLAVWPANIYVAVAGVDVEGQPGGAYAWVRLPLQLLFVGWALWSSRAAEAPAAAPAVAAAY